MDQEEERFMLEAHKRIVKVLGALAFWFASLMIFFVEIMVTIKFNEFWGIKGQDAALVHGAAFFSTVGCVWAAGALLFAPAPYSAVEALSREWKAKPGSDTLSYAYAALKLSGAIEGDKMR